MAVNEVTSVDVKTLTPFKRFIMTLGELPTSYLESMTYAELVMWFCNFLQEKVIPTVNNNADALQDVIHYLENLDLQDEVDHKLDEMADDGTLQEIVADYLNSRAIFGFDTVADMKLAENFIDGSFAQTLGYHSKNDGGAGLYKIREILNSDVVDEMAIIALHDDNLVAELIVMNDEINLKQYGAYGDGTHDDTNALKNALAHADVVYIPLGDYLITEEITINNSKSIIGCVATAQGYGTRIITEYVGALFKVTYKNCNFKNLFIENISDSIDNAQIGIKLDNSTAQSNTELSNVFIKKFYVGLDNYRFYDVSVSNCRFADCEYGVRVIEGTTSNNFKQCWALNCTYGYYLTLTNYSELNNCYSDSCNNPYYIDQCFGLSLISCGAEVSVNTPIQITYGNITIIGFYGYRNNSSGSNNADFIYITGNQNDVTRSTLNIIGCDLYNKNTSSTATNSIVATYSTINGYGNTLRKDISIDDYSVFNISYNTDGGQIYRNNIVNRYNQGSVLNVSGTPLVAVATGTIDINKYSPLAEAKLNITLATDISSNTQIGTIPSNGRPRASITGYAELNGHYCALYINTSGQVYLRNVGSTIPTGSNLVGSVYYFGY